MGDLAHVYVFGDETFDYSKDLHCLVHQNNDPLIISFFERTFYALRAEIGSLPQHRQRDFERFSSFVELSAQKSEGLLHPSLDQALSCAYQLAHFIRHVCGFRFSMPSNALPFHSAHMANSGRIQKQPTLVSSVYARVHWLRPLSLPLPPFPTFYLLRCTV